MGVAPYTWPHEREWQPGIHDKRTNLNMWFVLIIYLIFFIGFSLNAGPDLLLSDLLPVFIVMVMALVGIFVFFVIGQASKRDVKVEEFKYYNVRPERLSEALKANLESDRIRYRRDGPHQMKEDYWEDSFHLINRPWTGISLVVERNPLIARVDLASVTVRGMSRAMDRVTQVKDRVDGVAMQELLHRYEQDKLKDRPDLVVYGEE